MKTWTVIMLERGGQQRTLGRETRPSAAEAAAVRARWAALHPDRDLITIGPARRKG